MDVMEDDCSTNSSRSASDSNSGCASGGYSIHNTKKDNENINNNNNNTNTNTNNNHCDRRLPSWFVTKVTCVASLGGILFGYDLGVISGALPQLISYFHLTMQQQQVVVSILYVGGGLGAAVGGSLCDRFGRKRCILFTDFIFLLGAVILCRTNSLTHLYIGRIVVGFAVAVSGIADVAYLHEIAPVQWRGAIVSVNEACISLGFLLAFAIGCLLSDAQGGGDNNSDNINNGWRIMFGASGIVALIQFVGMWDMPESPTWLQENGRFEESRRALQRIHYTNNTTTNMTTKSSSLMMQQEEEQYQQQPQQQLLEMMGRETFAFTKVDDVTNTLAPHDDDDIAMGSSGKVVIPLPPINNKRLRRVVVYDTLTTTNDIDAVLVSNNAQAPILSSSTETAVAQHLRASSSSTSDNSLTPFCTTTSNNAAATTSSSLYDVPTAPTSSGTARRGGVRGRQRHPLSSSSSFILGALHIAWGLFVQALRHVVILVVQVQSFIVATMTSYRQQAYIALFLSVTQQFCGQTNVLSYAPLIFANLLSVNKNDDSNSDIDNDNDAQQQQQQQASLASMQAWATLSIGVVKFVVTVLVIWKIETLGRRFLLLTGMFTIAMGLLLLTVAFIGGGAAAQASQEQGSDTNDGEQVVVVVVEDQQHLGGFYLAVPGVLLVVCGYSMSFGPLTWLLTSELFPTDIRGRALGASTIVTYSAAAIVTSTFLSSQEWLGGISSVFALYFVVTVTGLVFAFMAIPDTKGKSVQEIEDDLNGMMWWRTTSTTTSATAEATTASAQYRHAQHESAIGGGGGGGMRQQQRTNPRGRQHQPEDGAMSRHDERDMILT